MKTLNHLNQEIKSLAESSQVGFGVLLDLTEELTKTCQLLTELAIKQGILIQGMEKKIAGLEKDVDNTYDRQQYSPLDPLV
jgi:hypothetical protein